MKLTALVAVAVLALAGCSSAATSTPAAVKVKSAPTTTTTPAPPTATVAAPDAPLALGQWFAFSDFKTRVIQVRQSASSPDSQIDASKRWYAALVQSCVVSTSAANPKGTTFSWGPWSVSDADGAQYEASSTTWEDFPRPAYPFGDNTVFVKGDCAKGWIMFSVLKSAKVSLIRYSDTAGDLGRWNG
jgi:hypothetical protein